MEPRVLRVTRDGPLADEWHLCLSAEGIAHHIEPVDGQLALVVDERDLARADEMLVEYDQERRGRGRAWPRWPSSSPVGWRTWSTPGCRRPASPPSAHPPRPSPVWACWWPCSSGAGGRRHGASASGSR